MKSFEVASVENQMSSAMSEFLEEAGSVVNSSNNTIHMSEIFLWHADDFANA
jgi:hypothetical protein